MYLNKPVRRSQLISPWGIGSICNFPGDESLMVTGLDIWELLFQQALNRDEFVIKEERLAQRLAVDHFMLPPDYRRAGPGVINSNLKIPFIRFPLWHYCPRCGAMEKLTIFKNRSQKCKGPNFSKGMSCHSLTDRNRPRLIPSRFIAICSNGHIEDFPFMEWVHKGPGNSDCQLRLRAGRSASSLSGIVVECISCDITRSMAGAFNENSLNDLKACSGQRPWLGEIDEKSNKCGNILRVVQRGASNVYFPQLRSSIYLPGWESSTKRRIIEILNKNWNDLTRTRINGDLNESVFKFIANKYNVNFEELMKAAREKLDIRSASENDSSEIDSEELYRKAEYEAIIKGEGGDNQDFYVTNLSGAKYDTPIHKFFSSISLIHKLRETRALVGFSRLLPDNGKSVAALRAELSRNSNIDWLPAIIVKGEGVFFEFNKIMLDKWLVDSKIHDRFNKLFEHYNLARIGRSQEIRKINPRFILIHTFAHVLINQFSFVCGYGSSALRERIYCDCDPETPENPMNGVLIYTASGDSEGSLGGLVRQGNPGYLEDIVQSALSSAQWCSADPICIDSSGQGPDSCNLAACHNCALLPETCCEEGNRLLDRAHLTGTPDNPELGYFFGFDNLMVSVR